MKHLFDELNGILPNTTTGKSSKWEILTRAIEFIRSQREQQNRLSQYSRETDQLRQEFDRIRQENGTLKDEAGAMWQQLRHLEPSKPHIYGHFSSQIAQEQTQNSSAGLSRNLPPIQNHWQQGANVMQGVEYPQGPSYERH